MHRGNAYAAPRIEIMAACGRAANTLLPILKAPSRIETMRLCFKRARCGGAEKYEPMPVNRVSEKA